MFKFILLLIFFYLPINASDDAISTFTYNLLKRVNDHIDDNDFVSAKRELDTISVKYFQSKESYERALINQLYGNYYAIQGNLTEAAKYYELSLTFKKMPFITGLQVRKNLAQCYFQLTEYEKVISLLEEYKEIANKRGQLFAPTDMVMLGIAYYQIDNFEQAYNEISIANQNSLEYKEDWLKYELVLTYKLEKFNESVELLKLLVFINPDNKEYWKQLSGFYYTQDLDDESLAGLELAYEKKTLSTEQEYLDLARYYLYKNLPQKSISIIKTGMVKGIIEKNAKNYELLADSYFLLKDRPNGISQLESAFKISNNPSTAFKTGRFAFEEEDWKLAIKYFKAAKNLDYEKEVGRIDLLLGISFYELNDYSSALQYLNNALNEEKSSSAAEGWISFIEDLQS